uniref:Putative mitoguardin n=1 Tax=Xenopsylla cheopis TaxID=163159 RepID=A0A6M2DKV9_XENCH
MSILSHFRTLPKLPNWKILSVFNNINLTPSQTAIAVTVTATVITLGIVARYLRRKRTKSIQKKGRQTKKRYSTYARSVNGDVLSQASSRRSASPTRRTVASSLQALSDRLSLASGSLAMGNIEGTGDCVQLTPQQLGVMGMEALETSITYWEDALHSFPKNSSSALAVMSPEEAEFCHEIQKLLDLAYQLQDNCDYLFLDQRSVLFRTESVNSQQTQNSKVTFNENLSERIADVEHSSVESFASAQDQVADLREFEEFNEMFPDLNKLPLYKTALKQFEENGIPYRSLRTELVHCGSDVEYLVKLHCIRLAFQYIFKDSSKRIWCADMGRQILSDLLLYGDKDPKDFLIGYEDMLAYIQNSQNLASMEQELSQKKVKALTFYDVVLDYIIIDAFEDLEAPPSSVVAVVQNRWLSNGFKETALTTAVWSVLKAKRRMLKYQDGFMSRFYTISEQMSPLMAWGFLGPDEKLKEMCRHFKEQMMGFLVDIYNFQKCRYTSVEELSSDIFKLLESTVNNISLKLLTQ